jgi:hypothetical protein
MQTDDPETLSGWASTPVVNFKEPRPADALFNGLNKQDLHALRLDKSALFCRQRGQLHGLSFEVNR